MAQSITFFLNGNPVELANPSPSLLLIDYLRSPEVKLAGAKKGCGQGGCGACTVILSKWDESTNKATHASINSCLRPVCSLHGYSITTVEGTGGAVRLPPKNPQQTLASSRAKAPFGTDTTLAIDSQQHKGVVKREQREQAGKVRTQSSFTAPDAELLIDVENLSTQETGAVSSCEVPAIDPSINPVAYRLAVNNGSQCGYCSTGFVMNMSAFLANYSSPTKKQIEDAFDGNLCRCTGYRPILTAMKTFAVDWSPEDEDNRMKLLLDDQVKAQAVGSQVTIPFPEGAQQQASPVDIVNSKQSWLMPTSVNELADIYHQYDAKDIYLLHSNTAFGIYVEDFLESPVLVDVSRIPELYGIEQERGSLTFGGGTTYTQLLDFINDAFPAISETSAIGALKFMLHRTAGTIVRNAATLAGNTMLVLKHIADGTGEPFPSDVFSVLYTLDAQITFFSPQTAKIQTLSCQSLVEAVVNNQVETDGILLLSYHIAQVDDAILVLAQKVALRDINAHSIVNSGIWLDVDPESLTINEVKLVFGAIAPFPWRAKKTEQAMLGKTLNLAAFNQWLLMLGAEVDGALMHWQKRMAEVKDEGFSREYKVALTQAYAYKAMLTKLIQINPASVPEKDRTATDITWGNWPVSEGTQAYKSQGFKAPVSEPYVKLMALYQTSGQVRYTHEMEVPASTLNAAFVQSTKALANFCFKHPETGNWPISAKELSDYLQSQQPKFERLITVSDIPEHGLKLIGMGGDQPVFAIEQVNYVGQSLALVVGEDEAEMQHLADFVSQYCVHYSPVNWQPEWQDPIVDLKEAITRGSIFPDYPETAPFVSHIWKIVRNHSQFDWLPQTVTPGSTAISTHPTQIDGANCTVVVSSQQCGGQAHFYMETQSCVGMPGEGEMIHIHPSSQSPMEMHQTAAAVLGKEHNQVGVHIRQLGGGYGGKTEQAKFIAAATAVATHTVQKPVRLVMPRDNDTLMIGKRHGYFGQYQIAIDDGSANPANKGKIRGFDLSMYGDGGAFYDCSFIVSNCIQTRIDNAYMVPNFRSSIDVCRTNTAPSTAFRAFGDIQGKLMSENAIDDAAYAIGMPAHKVREKNLYERGDVTPFGQALTYCYMRDVWHYLLKQSNFEVRQAEVDKYNSENQWRKRGIYILPVKYGSGYNLVQLEQASALVSIFSGDGSVLINQGGVDMGQGMVTKIEQVASYILNVPMDLIRINLPNTEVIPNPTSTGGSTGTAYNGLAVKQTCERIRDRLMAFAMNVRTEKGEQWCKDNGIDYWNYGEKGWATEIPVKNTQHQKKLIWQNLIALAYTERVSLVEAFNAKVSGGEDPMPVLEYKSLKQSQDEAIPGIEVSDFLIPGSFDSFCGFTYSAAVSEVEVDVLTGETKILRADLMYDMGWSINPALDIGQVEGAFIQGVGYVMTEKLVYEPEGEHEGRLNTVNTWRYKPPGVTNIPLEFNVSLFPRDLANVPDNPNELLSAKEVGEPPLVLATSVFFAIKAAIRASRLERGLDGLFQFDAPATVQEVRRACEVQFSE